MKSVLPYQVFVRFANLPDVELAQKPKRQPAGMVHLKQRDGWEMNEKANPDYIQWS
jgi:hypothetical protein